MTSQAIAVCLSQEAVSGVHHGQVAFFRLFFFSFFFSPSSFLLLAGCLHQSTIGFKTTKWAFSSSFELLPQVTRNKTNYKIPFLVSK